MCLAGWHSFIFIWQLICIKVDGRILERQRVKEGRGSSREASGSGIYEICMYILRSIYVYMYTLPPRLGGCTIYSIRFTADTLESQAKEEFL